MFLPGETGEIILLYDTATLNTPPYYHTIININEYYTCAGTYYIYNDSDNLIAIIEAAAAVEHVPGYQVRTHS